MDEALERLMCGIRARAAKRKRKRDTRKPIAVWTEKDVIGGKIADAMVVILNTSGCAWARTSGCTMCGYHADTSPNITGKDLLDQLESVKERYDGQPMVKIFTSGSFTNSDEIPISAAEKFITFFGDRCEKLCIESRTEYISPASIEPLRELPCKVEVGLGLESSNERVREGIINKNVDFEDYVRAASSLREADIGVKTYLLLKPPLMTEREAITDCIDSIEDAIPHSDTISVNPVNVQNFTLVDHLYHRGYYRPPWFYSLEEVFRRCLDPAKENGVWLMSAPSGAGTKRGIHNCGKCDGKYIEAVKAVSLGMTGAEVFDRIDCGCRIKWRCDVDTQDAAVDLISVG